MAPTQKTPRAVAYYRVSTQQQQRSGLGLDAQREAVARHIESTGAELLDEFTESESGKKNDRPELTRALRRCALTGATLVISKLDRLSRDLGFIANLRDAGVEFVCCDMPAANRFTIGMMAVLADYERQMISERTKAGLAAARARGVKLGGPNLAIDGNTDTRAATAARSAKAQARNAKLADVIDELEVDAGGAMSLRALAAALNSAGYTSPRGNPLTAKHVQRIRQSSGAASRAAA